MSFESVSGNNCIFLGIPSASSYGWALDYSYQSFLEGRNKCAKEGDMILTPCLLLLISMLWHRQAIFESKGDKLSSSAECRIRTWKPQDSYSPADWMPTPKPTELSRIKLKTWTQQPVPMMSEHSAHLTSLPFGFRTWLWRYTCLLLLISMLWHRQEKCESKGDKLSSSAECRIRTWKSQDTYSPADWMPTHKPTELSRIFLEDRNKCAKEGDMILTLWYMKHDPLRQTLQ